MTGAAMTLGEKDGPRIHLAIAGYQYPARHGGGTGKDWDANWLMVTGDAVTEDGRAWSFRCACLTTWQARRLADWLRGVVDGSVLSTPFDGSEAEHLLVFTEPNVAFSLADRTDEDAAIRVHLSLQSRPPWVIKPGGPGVFAYYLLLRMPMAQVELAIQDWERLIAVYPAR